MTKGIKQWLNQSCALNCILGQLADAFVQGNRIEIMRRSTLTQLNRGKGRHSVARAVFHGKRSELCRHYREGQEDQLGALGLVLNMIMLWNTIYMDAALNQIRMEGYPVSDEDVSRLSPLLYEHINMLGRYSFSVPEAAAKGKLGLLRNSAGRDN